MSLLVMKQEFTINGKPFGIEKIETTSDRSTTPNTLTATLSHESKNKIVAGSKVKWKAGYKSKERPLKTEFVGEVVSIKETKNNIIITAKDGLIALASVALRRNFYNTTLSVFLPQILNGSAYRIKDDPGRLNLRVSGRNGLQALEKLTRVHGLNAYFSRGQLIVDNPTNNVPTPQDPKFISGINIISDAKLKDRSGEKKLKITVKSFRAKTLNFVSAFFGTGTKSETIIADDLNYSQALRRAKTEYNERRGSGFIGNFSTFGHPSVLPGDLVTIVRGRKRSSAIVDSVRKLYDVKAAIYRQIISPGFEV